ncbi:P-loop containing nucleoside triphosphate hydrolase protein [Haematococcus lacustris]
MSLRPASASGTPAKLASYDLNGAAAEATNASIQAPKPSKATPSQDSNNANIDIFVRIRPVAKPSPRLVVDNSDNRLEFNMPRDAAAGYVNNQREQYEFRFNGIIGPEAKQDEVFERVARNVVMGSIEGFNGTIFAYGQTGSGKTFTITGGPQHYADRGIIPRTISTIFSEVTKRADNQFTVHCSYLEIYNETCFDLLDPEREIKAMEDLPRVHIQEDEEGRVSFRNLTIHRANNEEEALNLLFLGDTNRTISETPMNMASSRSHCIFSIYVEARRNGEDVVRRSKLNLVDLAGSERASKTGIDGTTLREAKYINLSLHYLEQVIIALQERAMGLSRPHIPYRNSRMTSVLRDSLGGNCRTVMVATINSESGQLDESISTCRFAMRVALVRNVVALNEEMDPSLVIRRLKADIRDLKDEIRMLKGGAEERGPLTPDELRRLNEQIEAFCADASSDASLNLGGSMMHVKAAFDLFKQLVQRGGLVGPNGAVRMLTGPGSGGEQNQGGNAADLAEQVKKLRLQVTQRDNEINILVGMLKRRDAAAASASNGLPPPVPNLGPGPGPGPQLLLPQPAAQQQQQQQQRRTSLSGQASLRSSLDPGAEPAGIRAGHLGLSRSAGLPGPPAQAWVEPGAAGSQGQGPQGSGAAPGAAAAAAALARAQRGGGPGQGPAEDDMALLLNANLLVDRTQAFELFRKSYRQNEVIEENTALLESKYRAAKEMGGVVNASKARMNELKALIEQRRIQRSVAAMQGDADAAAADDPEENRCKALIEKEKLAYKDGFEKLRTLKQEIEHLTLLLKQSRTRLLKDFEQYMALMARQGAQQGSTVAGQQDPEDTGFKSPIPPGASQNRTLRDSSDRWQGPTGAGAASAAPTRQPTHGPGGGSMPPPLQPGQGWQGGPPPRQSAAGLSSMGSTGAQGQAPQPRLAWGAPAPDVGPSPQPAPSLSMRTSGPGLQGPSSGLPSAPPGPSLQRQGSREPAVGLRSSGAAPLPDYMTGVDPRVLEQARPYLTGNPDADQDIVRFYVAKQQLLAKLQAGTG